MMKLKRKKGQGMVEYLLVLTAIVAAIIVATQNVVRPTVGNMFNHVSQAANDAVHHINYQ